MRDITEFWAGCFAGFTAGEGCFVIAKRNNRNPRTNYQCQFIITLRDDDRTYLKELQHILQMGKIRDMPVHCSHSPNARPTARFEIKAIEECVQLVRFFEKYPIPSKKRRDFEIWKQAVFELQKPVDCRDPDLLEYYFHAIKAVRQYESVESPAKPITINLQLSINFNDIEVKQS